MTSLIDGNLYYPKSGHGIRFGDYVRDLFTGIEGLVVGFEFYIQVMIAVRSASSQFENILINISKASTEVINSDKNSDFENIFLSIDYLNDASFGDTVGLPYCDDEAIVYGVSQQYSSTPTAILMTLDNISEDYTHESIIALDVIEKDFCDKTIPSPESSVFELGRGVRCKLDNVVGFIMKEINSNGQLFYSFCSIDDTSGNRDPVFKMYKSDILEYI